MRSRSRHGVPSVGDVPSLCRRPGRAVSVVIPALNEAENLPHVLPKIPSWVHEVLLVDGASTDDTAAVAQQLWPTIRIVAQEGNGKGAALRSGFAAATGDIIVMLDADGSTDPAELPVFVAPLLAGADVVKGSRFLPSGGTADMPVHRRWGNWCLLRLVQLLFGGNYTDLCYGYMAFWAPAARYLQIDADGFEIETMMNIRALQAGFTVKEVPSFEAKRVHGEGRLRTWPDGWRVLKTIWREWASPSIAPRARRGDAFRPSVPGLSVLPVTEAEHRYGFTASGSTGGPEASSF
jgi:glycosyltransferase involved in cell wall biosynthesis